MKRKCETCIKNKTEYCPNSVECFETLDMPYYKNRIMLLEENQKYKEVIDNIKYYLEENGNQMSEDATYDLMNFIKEV